MIIELDRKFRCKSEIELDKNKLSFGCGCLRRSCFFWIGGSLLLEQLLSESWGGFFTDHLIKKVLTTLSLKCYLKNNTIIFHVR